MLGTLSRSKRVISIVIALILIMSITMIYESGASANNAPKGDNTQYQSKNSIKYGVKTKDGVTVNLLPISDKLALKVVEKTFGPEIASKAKHRARITESVEANFNGSISPELKDSENWCGYYLKNDSLKNIRADFNASKCTQSSSVRDITWVGIGGKDSDVLIQTGISQYHMMMYWEVVPVYSAHVLKPVNEGDEIHSTVQNWYGNYYYICTVNATTGDYFTFAFWIDENPAGEGEWVVETPYYNNHKSQYHMGDFDDVTFTNSKWWGDDHQLHSINYAGEELQRVYMYNRHDEFMWPSVLSAGGTSFTVHPY